MVFYPELLKFNDGSDVGCTKCWSRRREEILEILQREEYGYVPKLPETVRGEILSGQDPEDVRCCSGHAELLRLRISFDAEKGPFSFPMHLFRPEGKEKAPLILLLNFRPDVYDKYYPAEEIIDHGFALGVIYYEDVTKDNGDMADGLAGLYERRNDGTDWGKLAMWGFAARCAMSYLETLPFIDRENVALAGHSRLGKAALLASAMDGRFKFTISNDSGCCGAAYERGKHPGGETVADITRVFPFWFCGNMKKYAGRPEEMPFDQHFLLSLIAPGYLLVGSASGDLWADPVSEEDSCRAVTPVWKLYGKEGYLGGDGPCETNGSFDAGTIAYHKRDGIHFLGRQDWLRYMDFMEKHLDRP